MNLNNVVLLSTFAETHALDYKRLRRMARKHEFDAPFKFGTDWMIDRDAVVPVMPERKTRTRSDGRTRFIVYVDRDGDELTRVRDIVGHDNVIDLRVVRLARKMANAVADANAVATNGNDAGIDV